MPPPCSAPASHHAVTRCRYELLLYLLDEQQAEIQGTRMSIEFLVDAEAEEPYAGEVSVGCSAMPKVRSSARAAIALSRMLCVTFVRTQPFCSRDAECGQGVCSEEGACLCRANYVGERCDVSILGACRIAFPGKKTKSAPRDNTSGNLSYLPVVHPKDSPQRCLKSSAFEQGASELLRKLSALHEMPKCWEQDSVMVFLVPHHGLGGNVHLMQQCITRALYHGKAAVFRCTFTCAVQSWQTAVWRLTPACAEGLGATEPMKAAANSVLAATSNRTTHARTRCTWAPPPTRCNKLKR